MGMEFNLACALCFGPNSGDVGAGLNPGLLVLFAAPYLVAGVFSFLAYRAYRRGVRARLAGGADGQEGGSGTSDGLV